MILTKENYYTPEADLAYMSCSQYEGFLECPAKTMAKLEGRWEEEPTEALIVGNYFHSYMEGSQPHEEFCQQHFADIYKTKEDKKSGTITITGKYAAYEKADAMIRIAERDATVQRIRNAPGPVEQIMTGELFGVPWKIRLDKHVTGQHMIVDYKTTKDIFATNYNRERGEAECFIEAYGYMMRAAVYSQIYRQFEGYDEDPLFLILAFSKQDPPAKGGFLLNHPQRYAYELEKVRENILSIMRIKEGRTDARRCGRCDYCRATAGNIVIKPYYVLKPGFGEGSDYDTADRSMDEV